MKTDFWVPLFLSVRHPYIMLKRAQVPLKLSLN